MIQREQTVTDCFQSWIEKNEIKFGDTFSSSVIYIESWGPMYSNLADVLKWFRDWNINNTVTKWDIKRFCHKEKTCVCEWYFECECDGKIDGFDGVSIIEFDCYEKIVWLKEFQCKIPNYYPYE